MLSTAADRRPWLPECRATAVARAPKMTPGSLPDRLRGRRFCLAVGLVEGEAGGDGRSHVSFRGSSANRRSETERPLVRLTGVACGARLGSARRAPGVRKPAEPDVGHRPRRLSNRPAGPAAPKRSGAAPAHIPLPGRVEIKHSAPISLGGSRPSRSHLSFRPSHCRRRRAHDHLGFGTSLGSLRSALTQRTRNCSVSTPAGPSGVRGAGEGR